MFQEYIKYKISLNDAHSYMFGQKEKRKKT